MNLVVKSQFTYYPPIWMFCSRTLNISLNHILKRAIRLVHNIYSIYFLEMSNRKKYTLKKFEHVAREIHEFVNRLPSPIKLRFFHV